MGCWDRRTIRLAGEPKDGEVVSMGGPTSDLPGVSRPATPSDTDNSGPGLAEYLPALLRRARIETIELDVLHRRPSFQGGEVLPRARRLPTLHDEHSARSFGFWEFVLAEAVTTDSETRSALLDAALRHNSD